jgi:two-component system OmpR family sensor kinase
VVTLVAASKAGGNPVVYFSAPSNEAGGPEFRVRASVLDDGDVLVVAQPLGDIGSTLHHLFLVELAVTGGALVVALLGGLWLVRLGLRPLRDMETTAESIAAGNLTERVPGENDKTEVGRLAGTLNLMLSRIESAFSARLASERRLRASEARLRRFVADASHELRTPIAAISAYAELFGRGASEQKEDLERLMVGIRSETGRMEHLVADLLLLARLDEGRPMEKRSVDVVALCAEAVQTASTVGPAWPLTFEASEPVEVMGDPTSIRQVVDNLLGNVRAHTPPGTSARVRVDAEPGGVVITTVRAWSPSRRPTSSSGSTARIRHGRAPTVAPGWGSPSSAPSSPLTAGRWPPRVIRAPGPPSPCTSPPTHRPREG